MRLGIVVLYMIKPENASLLQLHLTQIERMTSVPYRIYASIQKLPDEAREMMMRRNDVKVVDCVEPAPPFTDAAEHAHYLEALTRAAITDDVSHLAILHVDSFPIRPGWAEALEAMLNDTCAVVSVERAQKLSHFTACLFFSADFYRRFNPPYRLSGEVVETPQYLEFSRNYPHYQASGYGYLYTAYKNGLRWRLLPESNKIEDYNPFGTIFGGMIFHFDGAFRYGAPARNPIAATSFGRLSLWFFDDLMRRFFATSLKKRIRQPYQDWFFNLMFCHGRDRLLASPEQFLQIQSSAKVAKKFKRQFNP